MRTGRNYSALQSGPASAPLPFFVGVWPHRIHFAFKLLFREQLAEIIVATCASSLGIPKLVEPEPPWRMLNASKGAHYSVPPRPAKNADLRFP